ncbi:MAG: sugar phosphate nucleotidyltransferase [Nitriliruptorales bacterium]
MSDPKVRTALVVAGGAGTRLHPLTYTTPKPLLPFCGAPFLEGQIRRLAAAGVTEVLLVVGAEPAPFRSLVPVARELGVELDTVPEPEPLDTAGGVRSAVGRLSGPVLVLNGDVLTDVNYEEVARRHVAAGADVTIVLTEVEDTSSFGVAVRDGTRIARFVEKPAPGTLPGENAINAGTYVLDPDVLLAHPEGPLSFEHDVFPGVLARGGHVEGVVWDGVWADLGTPDRYRHGHRLVLDGVLDWPSVHDVDERGSGVRIAAGAEVAGDVTPPVLVLNGARIASGATVGPYAVLGAGVEVGADAIVADGAILHDGVRIGDGVVARGLVAGAGAEVETGATVAKDAVLGASQRVTRS